MDKKDKINSNFSDKEKEVKELEVYLDNDGRILIPLPKVKINIPQTLPIFPMTLPKELIKEVQKMEQEIIKQCVSHENSLRPLREEDICDVDKEESEEESS
jgi:hypothetical protein